MNGSYAEGAITSVACAKSLVKAPTPKRSFAERTGKAGLKVQKATYYILRASGLQRQEQTIRGAEFNSRRP